MKIFYFFLFALLINSCNNGQSKDNVKGKSDMKLKSSAFENGELIPRQYSCDGDDISPALSWENAPEETNSLALIVDDPDAPMGTWVHWVIFNIPPEVTSIKEKVPREKELENGAVQGTNDFKKIGYGGPCPPGGTHRYFFKLYALDTTLTLKQGSSKDQLLEAMESHVLAEAELMGKYQR